MGLPPAGMLEESGGSINWAYHFKVKAEVSGGTIRWYYLSEVNLSY